MQQIPSISRGFFVWASLCVFGVAHAESFRLSELMTMAAQNSPNVLQAKSKIAAANAELEAAKFSRYPTLTTGARTSAPSAVANSTSVDQPLWTGGRITGQINAAQSNLQANSHGLHETQLGLLSDLSGSVFDFLRFKEKIAISQVNVADHQRLVDLIQRRVANEISPTADLVLASSRLQQAIADKIQLGRQMEAARVAITRWVGREVTQVRPPQSIQFPSLPVTEWVSKAYAYSPQKRRLQSQVETAGHQVEVAGSATYPTVSVAYQHFWGNPLPFGYNRDQVFLNLQYQPGAGLSAVSKKQAAIQQQEVARQELANLELALAAEIKSTFSDVQSFNGLIEPARKLLDGNSEVVESYLRQYQVGRRNWLEVLNALREKNQAAYNLVDLQYARMATQVKLLLLSGDMTSQNLSAIHE